MRRSSPHFTVFGVTCPPPRGGDRFGITVSRKLGGAVMRNRLRRRTRELLRRLPAASGGPACNIVINPRPAVASADFRRLGEELASTLDKLRKALHTAARPAPELS